VVAQLELAVARAERDRTAPGQRRIAAPDRASIAVDRFGIAVDAVWRAAQVRSQAMTGGNPIPSARNDGSHLDGAERGHRRIFRVVTPRKADAFRIGGGFDQRVEKFRFCRRLGRQLVVVQKLRQRGVRPSAVDAVDRICVVAGDCQQALDAG